MEEQNWYGLHDNRLGLAHFLLVHPLDVDFAGATATAYDG